MSRSTTVVLVLLASFIVFVTSRGELVKYLQVLGLK